MWPNEWLDSDPSLPVAACVEQGEAGVFVPDDGYLKKVCPGPAALWCVVV